jgi:hypothetical protein
MRMKACCMTRVARTWHWVTNLHGHSSSGASNPADTGPTANGSAIAATVLRTSPVKTAVKLPCAINVSRSSNTGNTAGHTRAATSSPLPTSRAHEPDRTNANKDSTNMGWCMPTRNKCCRKWMANRRRTAARVMVGCDGREDWTVMQRQTQASSQGSETNTCTHANWVRRQGLTARAECVTPFP